MTYETILFDVTGHVATVTLNRPDRLNAFNQQRCEEFNRRARPRPTADRQ